MSGLTALAAPLAGVVYLATIWVLGESLCRRFLASSPRPLLSGAAGDRWALAAVLGMGTLAQFLFVFGLLGALTPLTVAATLLVVHVSGGPVWRELWRSFRLRRGVRNPRSSERAAPLLVLLALVPAALLACYPPTAFDATLYHLPYVESFLEQSRLTFLPELRFPVFPQAAELGFWFVWVAGGERAPHFTQLVCLLVTVGLLLEWSRDASSQRVGWLAAALWVGGPLPYWLASTAYIDLSLAVHVTAALMCWERHARGEDDRRWLVLAGLFLGFACAVKYLALFFVGCLALATLSLRRSARLVGTWMLAPCLLIAAPWYLRITSLTGSPLFPFYPSLFGETPWTSTQGEGWPSFESTLGFAEDLGEGVAFLIATPWKSWFQREVFHNLPPLSPYLLPLIAFSVFAVLRDRDRRGLGRWLVVAAYSGFWLTTIRDVRFLVPILPLLGLLLAERLDEGLGLQHRRGVALVLVAVLFLPGPVYGIYRLWRQGPIPTTPDERDRYLTQWIRGFDLIDSLEDEPSETVYALGGEWLRYYSEGPFLGDVAGPHGHRTWAKKLVQRDRRGAELEKAGVCFVLVSPAYSAPMGISAESFLPDLRLRRRAEGWWLFESPAPRCSGEDPRRGQSREDGEEGVDTEAEPLVLPDLEEAADRGDPDDARHHEEQDRPGRPAALSPGEQEAPGDHQRDPESRDEMDVALHSSVVETADASVEQGLEPVRPGIQGKAGALQGRDAARGRDEVVERLEDTPGVAPGPSQDRLGARASVPTRDLEIGPVVVVDDPGRRPGFREGRVRGEVASERRRGHGGVRGQRGERSHREDSGALPDLRTSDPLVLETGTHDPGEVHARPGGGRRAPEEHEVLQEEEAEEEARRPSEPPDLPGPRGRPESLETQHHEDPEDRMEERAGQCEAGENPEEEAPGSSVIPARENQERCPEQERGRRQVVRQRALQQEEGGLDEDECGHPCRDRAGQIEGPAQGVRGEADEEPQCELRELEDSSESERCRVENEAQEEVVEGGLRVQDPETGAESIPEQLGIEDLPVGPQGLRGELEARRSAQQPGADEEEPEKGEPTPVRLSDGPSDRHQR